MQPGLIWWSLVQILCIELLDRGTQNVREEQHLLVAAYLIQSLEFLDRVARLQEETYKPLVSFPGESNLNDLKEYLHIELSELLPEGIKPAMCYP